MKTLGGMILAVLVIAACEPEDSYGERPSWRRRGGVVTEEEPLTAAPADAGRRRVDAQEQETSSPDAGPAPVIDAAPPITAFSNTAGYQFLTPAKQSGDHHGGDSNAGKECLLCHTGAGAPKFALGGTAYTTKGSATGAIGAQVRIIDPSGNEIALVGTDADGNFWLKGDTVIPPGSRVGVRDGTRTKLMSGTIGSGSCAQSSCHGPTRPIFVGD